MPRSLVSTLICSVALVAAEGRCRAQEGATPPRWIWGSIPDVPSAKCPTSEVRWFRKAFGVKEPSRLAVEATADSSFVLYVDGAETLRGDDVRSPKAATVPLATGDHVLAVVATKTGNGPGGLLVRAGVLPLGQGVPVHTDASWRGTDVAPAGDAWTRPGFDDRAWPSAVDLGPVGTAPWNTGTDDVAARFKTPPGFKVERVAGPATTGSVVAFAFDEKGRPCVGVERDAIARLVDADGDGRYETRVPISPGLTNSQGFLFLRGKLLAVGVGPAGTGLYRLTDANGDEVFETIELIRGHDGPMGEHGPHAVVLGPDGKLYHNVGNHSHLKPPIDRRSPVSVAYEGELLPHYDDPRGHAVGILAPGGEIYRSDDDGASWTRVSAGYRNHYDFAFNRAGDLFSFDSDMEWDQGLPWYRPVRVTHATVGSEFGWRNGSAVWPSYFFDGLPPTLELGRGSPTGVTFQQGTAFPPEYDDALILCDWSQGRILAVTLDRKGAGYAAKAETLVSGQPLNCTDVEVGPDGSLYFSTGGRGTEGGLFRVRPLSPRAVPKPADPIDEVLTLGSPLSSFAFARAEEVSKSLGDDWAKRLNAIAFEGGGAATDRRIRALELLARNGPTPPLDSLAALARSDAAPALRARALALVGHSTSDRAALILNELVTDPDPLVKLRCCEGLIQQLPYNIQVERLVELLDHPDRFLRSAARTAIEHSDLAHHRSTLFRARSNRALIEGMLALVRGSELDAAGQNSLIGGSTGLLGREGDKLVPDELLDLLRVVQLAYMLGPAKANHPSAEYVRGMLLPKFPSADPRVSMELARLLAFLGEPKAVDAILKHQATIADRAEQIHYAYCLRALRSGWSDASKSTFRAWFQTAAGWDGGYSYLGFLDFMVRDHLAALAPADAAAELERGREFPFPTRILVASLDLDKRPELIPVLSDLYGRLKAPGGPVGTDDLRERILDAFARSGSAEAGKALREAFRTDPPRRDVAAALAPKAGAEDLPLLIDALETRDPNTAGIVVDALRRIDARPADHLGLRNLILLARRTGSTFTPTLNELAARWTGDAAPKTLEAWESAYRLKHADAPALPVAESAPTNNHALDDLVANVVRAGLPAKGSPERGLAVLNRARCLECHKFGDRGNGLGPDLTTLNSRFRPAEILEAVVRPSAVVSDQYRSVALALTDGRVLVGMPVETRADAVVLLRPDGTRTTVPAKEIEERRGSRTSVMPEGLLNAFNYQEIGDLLALFLAQPKVEVPRP